MCFNHRKPTIYIEKTSQASTLLIVLIVLSICRADTEVAHAIKILLLVKRNETKAHGLVKPIFQITANQPSTEPQFIVNIPIDIICELAKKFVVTLDTLGSKMHIHQISIM